MATASASEALGASLQPQVDQPLRFSRAVTPAPWLEAPSQPFPLWEMGRSSGGVIRMISPVLGETFATLVEPGLYLVQTRRGVLAYTPQGIRGLIPKGHRVVGVLSNGHVLSEVGSAPLESPSIDALIATQTASFAQLDRLLDASADHVVGLRGGELVHSSDRGASFEIVKLPSPASRALVRPDGVILAALTDKTPANTWVIVDAHGKVRPVSRALPGPARYYGWIFADVPRTAYGERAPSEVLTKDAKRFVKVEVPRSLLRADYVSLHPLFLGAPTVSTFTWPADELLVAPTKPTPPPKDGDAKDAVVGGVLGGSWGPDGKAGLGCEGLHCIAKLRSAMPVHIGSRFDARFFDDGLCEGPKNEKCVPGPLLRAPSVGLFDRESETLRLLPTPAACLPESLETMRGLTVMTCYHARYVADGSGMFVLEGPTKKSADAGFNYTMADDGTLVAEVRQDGKVVQAEVRRPLAPAGPEAWRDVARSGAVAYFPLPGGAALVALSNEDGNELTLSVDAPDGKVDLGKVPVTRPVSALRLSGEHLLMTFADDVAPREGLLLASGEVSAP